MKKIILFLLLALTLEGFSTIIWMGNHTANQSTTSQDVTFTVDMYDDYVGTHAEIGIDDGGWVTTPMNYVGNFGGNSRWTITITLSSGSHDYYFHGWDDYGANVWDNNGGGNYSISVSPATTTSDGNWNTESTWSWGVVPTSNDIVINNSVNLDTDISVTSLTINSSKSLTINSDKSLTVSGSLVNSGALIINSDASGTGSLKHNSNGISATVKRYFTGNSWDWHLISSPVVDQAIQNEFVPASFTANEDFYTWYEKTSQYVNYKNSSTAPVWSTVNLDNNFIEGKGYMIAYQATNPTKSFIGNLNNGEQTVAVTKIGSGDYIGSNLIGNPYPSSIDWKASSGWTRTPLLLSSGGYDIHIWNQSANNFGTYNSNAAGDNGTNSVTRYIPPMQGFFVAANESGSIIMDNNVRVHNGASNWLKNPESTIETINIKVESNDNYGYDEAIIEVGYEDITGGASKMFSFVETAPSIYLPQEGKNYSISFLNTIKENDIIPVNFEAGVDGNYTIIINFNSQSFNEIYFNDSKTGIKYNLKEENTVNFSSLTNDTPNRFTIHFGIVGVDDQTEAENIQAYVNGNELTILGNSGNTQLEIINMQGQVVLSEKIQLAGRFNKKLDLKSGIYIVKTNSSSNKVIISN